MAAGSLSGDIQVITADPVTGRITFGLVPRILTGMPKLIQIVVLSLLNSPGKDILKPADGGGILNLVGSNISSTDSTMILAELNRAVKKSQTEIINYQTGLGAPAEESLKELQVLSLTEGENIDEVLLSIRIINQAGRISDVVL
jgi:hypothetical protein